MTRLFSILLVVTFHFSLAWAQVTTGTVLGTVQDSTGAVLPGVEVVVTHVDTGISRTIISDDEGRYLATNLSLGNFEIVASLPGFQTEVRTGIAMTIGRRAVVNFTLTVGEITERVTVTGEAPLVETTTGSLGSLVDRHTVLELPLNGRDLTGLLTLQAGTAHITTGRQAANSGFSQRVSISGARPQQAAVLLDGTGVKGTDQGLPAGVSGNFLGGEGVQEFKIERNSYSAQFGGAAGGVINVVSKSGSNEFHGSIYEFHRNDNLDASNFISNRDGAGKPPFIRNQFGFSVGGPIIRNKTFFFWNYEGMRDRESSTRNRDLPNLDARRGFLPLDLSDPANPTIQIGAPVVEVPGLQERVRPFFRLWPEPGPTAVDRGDGTTRESINTPRSTDEDYYQLRVDHNFSDSDSLFGRYTFQNSTRLSFLALDRWGNNDRVDNDFVTLEQKHIFSPQLLNTFRFGFSHRGFGQAAFEDPLEDFDLRFIPEEFWSAPLGADYIQGQISLGGVSNPGVGSPQGGAGWYLAETQNWEYYDDLMYTRGPHSMTLGFTWAHILPGGINPSRPAGAFGFEDLVTFWQADPTNFRGSILPGLNSERQLDMNVLGFYVQDDWQLTPKLTANLGLRYEFYTVPTEKLGQLSNLKDPLNDTTITVSGQILDANGEPTGVLSGEDWFKNPSLSSIMPRIGLAWDPTGSGKTALRLGAGLFYNHIQADTFRRAVFRSAPFVKETNFSQNVAFPDVFDQVVNEGIGAVEMQPFDYNMKNPHMYQWNLNIQREVLSGTAATIGYVGSRGLNLLHQTNINAKVADNVNGRLVYAADAARPNTSELFGDLQLLSQDASTNSWYHGLQMGLQRRFRDGYQLQLSYTYSRTIDESSNINSVFNNNGGGVSYWPQPALRRSLAAFHVATAFSASGVWMLPIGQGQALGNSWNNLTETFLGGWQLSGILRMADGPATSVTMQSNRDLARGGGLGLTTPDLAPGGSLSPVLGTKDSFNYFDVSAFVPPPAVGGGSNEIRTLGTVGRNTLIAPGVANLDFSLTKNTQVTETVKVQFRSEFFNILNRANFSLPDTGVFGRTGNVDRDAGELNSTTTDARQIQFGLRIVF